MKRNKKIKCIDKIIAIYVRVSREEQKKLGHSIASQKKTLLKLAKDLYPDHKIKIYNDEGISAGKPRPELKNLTNDVLEDRIEAILFTRIDRMFRDVVEGATFLELCDNRDICIITIYNKYILSNPNDESMLLMELVMSQRELKILKVRTKEGVDGGLSKGIYSIGGKPPFGYRRSSENTLVFDYEIKAKLDDLIQTFLYTSISKNQLKVIYDIGSNVIDAIFSNPIYRGFIIYQGNSYEITQDIYITEEYYNLLQIKLKTHYQNRDNYTYLFKNKLICKDCESKLACDVTLKKNAVYLYYTCNCRGTRKERRINEQYIYNQLSVKLNKLFENKNSKYRIMKAEDYEFGEKIKYLEEQRVLLEKSKKKLLDSFINHDIDEDDYLKRKNSIFKKLRKIEKNINKMISSCNYNKYLKSIIINNELETHAVDLASKIVLRIN